MNNTTLTCTRPDGPLNTIQFEHFYRIITSDVTSSDFLFKMFLLGKWKSLEEKIIRVCSFKYLGLQRMGTYFFVYISKVNTLLNAGHYYVV